jgi:hypothetical protein
MTTTYNYTLLLSWGPTARTVRYAATDEQRAISAVQEQFPGAMVSILESASVRDQWDGRPWAVR